MLVRAFAHVRHLVLEAGQALVDAGRLDHVGDVWFLELQELPEVMDDTVRDVRPLVAERRLAHERHKKLTPPRLLTSEGESPVVELSREDLPEGALAGSPASAGDVVGTARVITDPARQVLHKGEILVAPFTDPGWTPLFINASGLVMEVGGLMTHGSVVAREYGIPAVVSVPDATKRIRTGQRIRVQGDAGYVQILPD
jgi:pyruvate,water dikinase